MEQLGVHAVFIRPKAATKVEIPRNTAVIHLRDVATRAKGAIAHSIDHHQRHAVIGTPKVKRTLDRLAHRIAERIERRGPGQRDPPGAAFDADIDLV